MPRWSPTVAVEAYTPIAPIGSQQAQSLTDGKAELTQARQRLLLGQPLVGRRSFAALMSAHSVFELSKPFFSLTSLDHRSS